MAKANHVKEVQTIIDVGMNPEDATKLYDQITDKFTEYFSVIEVEEFHHKIGHLRVNDKRYFRQIIDEVAREYGLSWREVKYNEQRVKRCETCQSWFYTTARNGRSLTCERFGTYRRFDMTNRRYYYWFKDGRRLSECAVKYELSKRPNTVRRVQEVLYDPQPSGNDIPRQMFLQDVEEANQHCLNPYENEWKYWR
ncbi:hypothetical protein V1502_17020 [Bacillus sp. SCS-153A]|uniref:hypothetical protein n=1 Tax=Rossellomorea sedimentorum TaxID=3115294 RepID=UPI0039057EEB